MGVIRDTCSFFRSIYEGCKRLKPPERLEIYEVVFNYMFYDVEVDAEQVKPTTYLAFTSNKIAFDNAKARYDKQKECGDYGKLGAEFGRLGGRGKKKTPENPPGGLGETPKNPQEIEIEVSKKVSNKYISQQRARARGTGRKSYDELIKEYAWYFFDEDDFAGDEYLIEYENCEKLEVALKEFVQMRSSKSLLTNAGLEELFLQLDGYDTKEKTAMVKRATSSGWSGFFPTKDKEG